VGGVWRESVEAHFFSFFYLIRKEMTDKLIIGLLLKVVDFSL